MTKPIEEMREDYNWREAFGFAGNISAVLGDDAQPTPFGFDDVARVLASDDGENDGANWVAILELKDGRFAYLTAGCDYTGWDCQSSGQAFVATTRDRLWQYGVDADAKPRLAEAVSP